MKILLGLTEVNPNKSDNKCRVPLSYEVANGYERVVKMLLACKQLVGPILSASLP